MIEDIPFVPAVANIACFGGRTNIASHMRGFAIDPLDNRDSLGFRTNVNWYLSSLDKLPLKEIPLLSRGCGSLDRIDILCDEVWKYDSLCSSGGQVNRMLTCVNVGVADARATYPVAVCVTPSPIFDAVVTA